MDNNLKIINYLAKNQEPSTMHQLSQILNIPYATFYRTINKMTDILTIKTIGKAKTITLNTSNPIITSYLAISSEQEKNAYKNPIIKKIAKELKTKDIVLLFGSYAKNKQTQHSDIDLLIINNGKRNIDFSKYELLYKKQINAIFMKKQEFKQPLKYDGKCNAISALDAARPLQISHNII